MRIFKILNLIWLVFNFLESLFIIYAKCIDTSEELLETLRSSISYETIWFRMIGLDLNSGIASKENDKVKLEFACNRNIVRKSLFF